MKYNFNSNFGLYVCMRHKKNNFIFYIQFCCLLIVALIPNGRPNGHNAIFRKMSFWYRCNRLCQNYNMVYIQTYSHTERKV